MLINYRHIGPLKFLPSKSLLVTVRLLAGLIKCYYYLFFYFLFTLLLVCCIVNLFLSHTTGDTTSGGAGFLPFYTVFNFLYRNPKTIVTLHLFIFLLIPP